MENEQLIRLYNERGKKLKPDRKIFFAKYRKLLLQETKGKTLEAAAGAGANFAFYPSGVELTAVDFSPVLLEIAAAVTKDLGLR
ncbi:MAG TPA: hypothetical protein VIM29_00380 [Bacillota bacterium]